MRRSEQVHVVDDLSLMVTGGKKPSKDNATILLRRRR